MSATRSILHADMDAFYASIEQRDRPELAGRPVIVGGTGWRGVVTAASYEARRFGVHSAMPAVEARRRCPQGIFLRGDLRRYARESMRIFAIFRRFTPLVEGLSLDEAFLDVSGTERLLGPPLEVAKRLRATVRDETGLPVSVGIAPLKMVAKIASDLAKPDGLLEVRAVREFLDPLPVGRMWGVGPVAEARLRNAGYRTIGDLARADPERLEGLLGAWGIAVARLARGRDLREVEPYRDAVSYGEENTFARDVAERSELEGALLTHAEAVARRLRRDEVRARTVVLKLKLGRRRGSGRRGYPLLTRQRTLAEATDDGDAIFAAVRSLLEGLELAEAVRLVGVAATGLHSERMGQLPLFEPSERVRRRRRLNRALDELSDRFGPGAVTRAGQGRAERAALTLQIKRGERASPSSRPEAGER